MGKPTFNEIEKYVNRCRNKNVMKSEELLYPNQNESKDDWSLLTPTTGSKMLH